MAGILGCWCPRYSHRVISYQTVRSRLSAFICVYYTSRFFLSILKSKTQCRGGCNASIWPAGGAAAPWTLLSQLWLESGWSSLPEVIGLPEEQQLLWSHRLGSAWRSQGRAWLHSPLPALSSVPQRARKSILRSSQHPKTIPPGRELRIAMLSSQHPFLCLTQIRALWIRVRATWVKC